VLACYVVDLKMPSPFSVDVPKYFRDLGASVEDGNYDNGVRFVYIDLSKVSDIKEEDLWLLKDEPDLDTLDVSGHQFPLGLLSEFKSRGKLWTLKMNACGITDDHVRELAGFSKLDDLGLVDNPRVTDISPLRNMKICVLGIGGTGIDDGDLGDIAAMCGHGKFLGAFLPDKVSMQGRDWLEGELRNGTVMGGSEINRNFRPPY
jgi:hypothetical protein